MTLIQEHVRFDHVGALITELTEVSIHLGKAKRFNLTCCWWVQWRARRTVSGGKSPARSGPDRSSCPAGGDAEPCGRSYTVSSRWPFLKWHTSQGRNSSQKHYWWITKEITFSSQRDKTHNVGGVRVSDVVEWKRLLSHRCEPTRLAQNISYTTQNLSAPTARAGNNVLSFIKHFICLKDQKNLLNKWNAIK